MHPTLFEVGGFPVGSYGVAAGFALSVGVAAALRRGLPRAFVLDLCFWALVGALLGGRLSAVLEGSAWLARDAGSSWGAALGALAAVAVVARGRVVPVLDALAPPALLAVAGLRVGCLLHGCCPHAVPEAVACLALAGLLWRRRGPTFAVAALGYLAIRLALAA